MPSPVDLMGLICFEAPLYKNKTDPAGLNNPEDTWYVEKLRSATVQLQKSSAIRARPSKRRIDSHRYILNGAAGHYDGLDTFDDTMMKYSRFGEDTKYSWSELTFHSCSHMTQQAIDSATGGMFEACACD